jgi:hypothetical protein
VRPISSRADNYGCAVRAASGFAPALPPAVVALPGACGGDDPGDLGRIEDNVKDREVACLDR